MRGCFLDSVIGLLKCFIDDIQEGSYLQELSFNRRTVLMQQVWGHIKQTQMIVIRAATVAVVTQSFI